MRTPIRPLPESVARWMWWARYLRWSDAAVATLAVWGAIAFAGSRPRPLLGAVAALAVVGLLSRVPLLRARWRPASGWVGWLVTRRLRPGDRAWWIQTHRCESVVVTARRGRRLTIALAGYGESEVLRVRRTRTLIVPADHRR